MNVIRNHGLIAVPIDVDIDKLAPNIEDIEQRITPKVSLFMEMMIFMRIDKSDSFELYLWSHFLH